MVYEGIRIYNIVFLWMTRRLMFNSVEVGVFIGCFQNCLTQLATQFINRHFGLVISEKSARSKKLVWVEHSYAEIIWCQGHLLLPASSRLMSTYRPQ